MTVETLEIDDEVSGALENVAAKARLASQAFAEMVSRLAGLHPAVEIFRSMQTEVEKTRALLSGVTAEEIRTTADLRSRLKTGMSEIATKLDAMVVTMPRRKFRLDE